MRSCIDEKTKRRANPVRWVDVRRGSKIRPDRAYSLDTAAKAQTICTRTLSERIERGAIRAIPVGKRRKAVPGAEILRILAGESSIRAVTTRHFRGTSSRGATPSTSAPATPTHW